MSAFNTSPAATDRRQEQDQKRQKQVYAEAAQTYHEGLYHFRLMIVHKLRF